MNIADDSNLRRSTIAITTTDEGAGVPEQALEQIFDPFFRIASQNSHKQGGADWTSSVRESRCCTVERSKPRTCPVVVFRCNSAFQRQSIVPRRTDSSPEPRDRGSENAPRHGETGSRINLPEKVWLRSSADH